MLHILRMLGFFCYNYKRLIPDSPTFCYPSWIYSTFTIEVAALWPDSSSSLTGAAYAQKPGPKWGSNYSGVWGEATCLGATDGRAETELRLAPAAGDLPTVHILIQLNILRLSLNFIFLYLHLESECNLCEMLEEVQNEACGQNLIKWLVHAQQIEVGEKHWKVWFRSYNLV